MSGSGERLPTWVGESGRGGDDDGENEQVDGVNNRDGSDRSSSSGSRAGDVRGTFVHHLASP